MVPVVVRWGSLWRARRPSAPLVDRRNRSECDDDGGDDDGGGDGDGENDDNNDNDDDVMV